jgi:REP element-mobilizing transposase RayT
MPRPLRIHVPGAFYHVTLRGNHRQNIFFTPADRQLLDDLTAEVVERFNARVDAYCWMTNHVHMVIQAGEAPLGKLMMRIAGRYARTIQSRLRTTGHLFEKRYYPVVVDADEYLLELLRYIHLNPVRARMVAHPRDYPWSSHHAYCGSNAQPWVTTDFALSMFHAQRDHAVAAYQRFINQEIDSPSQSPLLQCNANDGRILGSDDFAAKLLGAAWQPRSRKTLADVIVDACRQFAIEESALRSRSAHRQLTKARAWVAHQATTLRIASLSEVARVFDRRESSLRECVKRHFNYP